MEARQHLLAQVVVITQRTPAPPYKPWPSLATAPPYKPWPSLATAPPYKPWPSLATAPPYNAVAVSRDHDRLTTRRTTCPSAPAYNATDGSFACAASDATVVFTVRLSRPGLYQHTGPHLSG